jgi:hypothetical protein
VSIDNDRDRVRILIGDTDEDDPLVPDDQIAEFLTQRTLLDSSGGTLGVNIPAAAADCAGAIAAKFARSFDFGEDGQTFRTSQRVAHYTELSRQLRNRAGGISVPVTLAGTETT